ncbi:MAG: tetratricopeptide repeat protein [Treponemataceae bacterium]
MLKLKLYIEYFKDKIYNKFFKKEKKVKRVDLDEIKGETWILDVKKDCRFENEETDDYKTQILTEEECIEITAKRKNVYAWTVNKYFRYADFVLDFTLVFDEQGVNLETEKAGTCAAGVLFRYLNSGVFYAFLVSDQAWIRMDVMINGSPFTVLAWTKPVNASSLAGKNSLQVKLVSVDTSFHIFVEDEWCASVSNDVIQSAGKIALAVQNWENFSQCTCKIKNLKLNSMISSVENLDNLAQKKADTNYAARINLAKTFYAMGKYDLASAEIDKAQAIQPLETKDAISAGRIFFSHGKFDEAEKAFTLASKNESDKAQAYEELAGLYYYTEKFEKLGNFLESVKTKNEKVFDDSCILQNFAGHYFHSKGEHKKAAEHYGRAFTLKSDEGLFALNATFEYEQLLNNDKVYDWLIKAGYAFLQTENYTDLVTVVDKLEGFARDDEQTLTLLGKFYFGVENYNKAFPYFETLCKKLKTKDASNWYLYALLIKNEEPKNYLKFLEKATKLDSSSSLYFFRLAEAEFYAGKSPDLNLEKSLKLNPKNAWSYNLKALVGLKENNLDEALENIIKARKILPDEISLLANYVEIKRRQGQLAEVLPLFDLNSETVDVVVERNRGEAFHLLANSLYNDGQFEEANIWYKKTEKLLPENYDFLLNNAQNLMELGYLNEADANLVKALDMENRLEVYRLLARLSTLKGNYLRAEAVIDEALANYPDAPDLYYDLVIVQWQFNKKVEAENTYKKLASLEKSERVKRLKEDFFNKAK